MEILLYISAFVAALSLLLIAIFVIITLKSAKTTMGEVSETLKRVETKISGITEKTEQLMEKTNEIALDAEQKLTSFDSLKVSAENFGQSATHMNESIQQVSTKISTPPQKYVALMQKSNVIAEVVAKVYYSMQREKEKR